MSAGSLDVQTPSQLGLQVMETINTKHLIYITINCFALSPSVLLRLNTIDVHSGQISLSIVHKKYIKIVMV